MKKLLAFMVLSLFLIGSFPAVSNACSCAELPTVAEELERSDAVFSGKVIEIKEEKVKGYMTKKVLFQVTNTWKGMDESQAIITTGLGGGDCGFRFIEGQEYLVYAKESDMYGAKSLTTIMCDRTDTLRVLQDDLELLGAGKVPTEKAELSRSNQNSTPFYLGIAGALAVVALTAFFFMKRKKK
ncbi:LPXTG cell wall anchor domain-containing protein [Mesobacillus sp. LC4]